MRGKKEREKSRRKKTKKNLKIIHEFSKVGLKKRKEKEGKGRKRGRGKG